MPVNAVNDKLGWKAPEFKLLDVSGKMLTFDELRGKKGTIIAFICNHCPYVISIVNRLTIEANELKKHEINTVAIMPNDVLQYPDDSYENMKIFSKKYNFSFPYLYDENQDVAKNYKAVCTPDIFGFNNKNLLCYRGRIDSGVMNNESSNINRELYNAMLMIKKNGLGPIKQFNSFGCSIKWK